MQRQLIVIALAPDMQGPLGIWKALLEIPISFYLVVLGMPLRDLLELRSGRVASMHDKHIWRDDKSVTEARDVQHELRLVGSLCVPVSQWSGYYRMLTQCVYEC